MTIDDIYSILEVISFKLGVCAISLGCLAGLFACYIVFAFIKYRSIL